MSEWRRIRKLEILTLVAALATVSAVRAQAPEPHTFLQKYAGFSDTELREMDQGKVVVKTLRSPVGHEITIVGVALFKASTEFFLRMYRDIERFESGLGPLKKISDPPHPGDFEAMTLPDRDVEALSKCRIGDCDLKLGETSIARFQTEVDWDDPQAGKRAQAIFRELALAFTAAYQHGGNQALGVGRDKKRPTLVREEFEGLLENSPYLPRYVPELHRYLLEYPEAELSGATDFLYWALNDFGLDPVLRLSHVTIYQPEEGENASAVIASKQLYFSRYFHTGLDLRFLVRNERDPGDGSFYFVSLARVRSDEFGGLFGGLIRAAAEEGARDGLQQYIEVSKNAIESYYRAR
jgi:hypothetical protein